eukprot:gene45652-55877_t
MLHRKHLEAAPARAAVVMVWPAVGGQLPARSIRQGQRARTQTPCPAADERAHGELPVQIALQAVVAQRHIGQTTLTVGHRHLHQAGTVVAHRHLQAACAAQGEKIGALPVQVALKRFE